jgi:hypothetical protein
MAQKVEEVVQAKYGDVARAGYRAIMPASKL